MLAPNVFHLNSSSSARSGGLPRRNSTLALLLYHSGHLAARISHRQTRSGGAAIAISLCAYTDELSGSNPAGHFIAITAPLALVRSHGYRTRLLTGNRIIQHRHYAPKSIC